MKNKFSLLLLALALLAQPAFAQEKNTAKQLVGEWRCTQHITPEEGLSLTVEFIQLFTAQRNFTLDGKMEMQFNMDEMKQMFGGSSLSYIFEGSGSWSTLPGYLIIKTENSNMTPNSPVAQQLHDAGLMDVNDLKNMKSEDQFIIISLDRNFLKLKHSEEDFITECTRTQ